MTVMAVRLKKKQKERNVREKDGKHSASIRVKKHGTSESKKKKEGGGSQWET